MAYRKPEARRLLNLAGFRYLNEPDDRCDTWSLIRLLTVSISVPSRHCRHSLAEILEVHQREGEALSDPFGHVNDRPGCTFT